MVAEVVATPVLERLRAGAAAGVVRGATARAAYLDLGGFVVALTAPGIPLMPNGIAVPSTAVHEGAVRGEPGRIEVAGDAVTWDPDAPPAWEPRLPGAGAGDADALRARGAAIRAALADAGSAPDGGTGAIAATARGRAGLEHLHRALADRDRVAAGAAADRLTGLGGGLTPEGDDVLTATAAIVAATGGAAGFTGPDRAGWLAALVPGDVDTRTTALSATLLTLAADGRIVEPVHRLLDPAAGEAAWRDALATLVATGASTGRAYAATAGATLGLLLGED